MKRITLQQSKDYIKLDKLDDTAVAFTRELQEDDSDKVTYYTNDISIELSNDELKQLMEGYDLDRISHSFICSYNLRNNYNL